MMGEWVLVAKAIRYSFIIELQLRQPHSWLFECRSNDNQQEVIDRDRTANSRRRQRVPGGIRQLTDPAPE
ncbi:hypothetical protein GCM10023319_34610 [Nocardia iowensis]